MKQISFIIALMSISACSQPQKEKVEEKTEAPHLRVDDPHSFARPRAATVTHLDLTLNVDFQSRELKGIARWDIKTTPTAKEIIFDTNGLSIDSVTTDGQPASFVLNDPEPFIGRALHIPIKPESRTLSIWYRTKTDAEALQWLSPAQTADKKSVFLYTQSQAILARTWIPCQDSPGIRFTYKAQVTVPKDLIALMSAQNPQERNNTGVYSFEQKEPVPSYLMALAVGDIYFKDLGGHTGVYAEKGMLAKCVSEFRDLPKMVKAAEQLYGPYRWGRYDVLVLPPSFPFGGMENPNLTFATPTIITGDRSLVTLIAHELAHSWSGNLVTNASWNDMWLNEGFTMYFERRIMESLEGRDYADMLTMLGFRDLKATLKDLGPTSKDTHLKMDLAGRNPDDGLTDIAYEKGFCLLRTMEDATGREKMDVFLKKYFESHAFQTITSEEFIDYYYKEFIGEDKELARKIDIERWVFEAGLPENCPRFSSLRFNTVDSTVNQWIQGVPASKLKTKDWSAHEWQHFVSRLPETLSQNQLKELDKTFRFTKSGNSEILCLWLDLAIKNHYTPAYPKLKTFLTQVGRRKFLLPLYKSLVASKEGKEMAKAIYVTARPNYHYVSQHTIDDLLR